MLPGTVFVFSGPADGLPRLSGTVFAFFGPADGLRTCPGRLVRWWLCRPDFTAPYAGVSRWRAAFPTTPGSIGMPEGVVPGVLNGQS